MFPAAAIDFVVLRPGTYRWPAYDVEYTTAVHRLLDEEGFGVVVRTQTLVILRKGAPAGDNEAVKAMLPPAG